MASTNSGHLERISCGVSIHLSQQGEYPAFPDGLWAGNPNSGASLRFEPDEEKLVFCVYDHSERIVNIPLFYVNTDLGYEENRRALIQVDHNTLTVDRLDPNVNNELMGQVAIDNAIWALFKTLLPSYTYRGNPVGLQ